MIHLKLVAIFLVISASLPHAVALCTDTSICTVPGRYVTRVLDFHTNVASPEDCCSICNDEADLNYNPKCRYWTYKANRGQCTLFDKETSPKRYHNFLTPEENAWVRSAVNRKDGCPALLTGIYGDPCGREDGSCDGDTNNICADHCEADIGCGGSSFRCICFAASSVVNILKDGGKKQIRVDELDIGDKVLTVGDLGQFSYQEFYYESHGFPTTGSEVLNKLIRISYADGFVDISAGHLLPLFSETLETPEDKCMTVDFADHQFCMYDAELVSVGDTILISNEGENGEYDLKQSVVTSVSVSYDTVRAPRVLNGHIVTNNVIVSMHQFHHNTEDATYSFIRLIYYLNPSWAASQFVAELWQTGPLGWVRRMPRKFARNGGWVAEAMPAIVYGVYLCVLVGCYVFLHKMAASIQKRVKRKDHIE